MKKFLLIIATILLILSFTGFLGQSNWLLDLTSHFRIQYLFISLFLLIISLLYKLNCKTTLGVLALIIAINTAVAWPYLFPTQKRIPQTLAPDFKLVQLNLWQDNEVCQKSIDWVLSQDADYVALEEVDLNCFDALNEVTFQQKYPYQVHAPESRILLASKTPLESHVEFAPRGNKAIIVANTTIDNQPLTLLVTHPDRPNRSKQVYQDQIDHVKKLASLAKKGNLIILGDLNTTPFSSAYRQLMNHANLTDTMTQFGLTLSYPARFPEKWIASKPNFPFPVIAIDHVLYQGDLIPLSRERGPNVGSDHYPIVSTFSFKTSADDTVK